MADDLSITSLRGGMNDTDPISELPDDQCVYANNVEWFYSALGERRLGCEALDVTGSDLDDETAVVHLAQRFPTNDVTLPEFWALGATPGTSTTWAKRAAGLWAEVVPDDAMVPTAPDVYNVTSQALHGKLFFAYPSAQDRLHVWDGTYLRRVGLAEPAVPTVANEGGGAYAATIRYYRVRYIEKSGTVILRRSEPSDSVPFTPSGAGAGVRIAKPAAISEHETHWEIEASVDDADFYILTTLAVGTTTYDDTTNLVTTDYADLGELSEDIGDYLLPQSARFLAADGDRLLWGGHFTDASLASRVAWSPPFNDPGKGNDERLPLDVDNYVDLDVNEGGSLTGISQVANGTWYAFKWLHIYTLMRTGDPQRAYDVITVSKTRGAIPGSIVSGMDENGRGCIYFLDPIVGPSRLGPGGLEAVWGLRTTWKRVNLSAQIISRGVYYPNKQQVHWWVAADGANTPSLKFVLHVGALQDGGATVRRGFSLATGRIAEALCVTTFNEIAVIDGSTSLSVRPFIGLTAPDYIQRCDTQDDDTGVAYTALIRTKPYFLAGLCNKWGERAAALLASANVDARIRVRAIRDFGLGTDDEKEASLAPVGDELYVIKQFDSLRMSEARSIQFEFTDPAAA